MSVEAMLTYAPILERVVDLVLKDKKLPYGDALNQAIQEQGIEVPAAVQNAILIAALKISVLGFPSEVES